MNPTILIRFALLLPLGAALAAYAGETVDEAREVAPDGIVQIDNVRGEVSIVGWDEAVVAVEGEIDDLATEFIFEVDGDHTLIKVVMPKRDVNYGDGSDLTISVPHQSRVEFSGVSTDVSARAIAGGIIVRSVSGDLEIEEVAKEVVLKTVSGDIFLEDARGRVRVNSVSGEMRLIVQAEEVYVDTVSGDVDLNLERFERLSSTTVSGDQDVRGEFASGGRIDMKSVSGEIELYFAGPVDAEISVSTGPGGDIINDLTRDRPEEMFPARAMLRTTAGDGSGDIRISSVTGDVSLRGGD